MDIGALVHVAIPSIRKQSFRPSGGMFMLAIIHARIPTLIQGENNTEKVIYYPVSTNMNGFSIHPDLVCSHVTTREDNAPLSMVCLVHKTKNKKITELKAIDSIATNAFLPCLQEVDIISSNSTNCTTINHCCRFNERMARHLAICKIIHSSSIALRDHMLLGIT